MVDKSTLATSASIVAVGNLKGGTGKSTVAVNLACALADQGQSTVVIDTDPQLTATQWLDRRSLPARVFEAPMKDPLGAPPWLEELPRLAASNQIVVFDLPAVLGTTMAAAFLLADLILIPTSASELDLAASTRTLFRVAKTQIERQGSSPTVLLVPTRIDGGLFGQGDLRSLHRWTMRSERLTRAAATITSPIRFSADFARAFEAGQWIGSFAPRSRAHRDMRRLARSLDTHLLKSQPTLQPAAPSPSNHRQLRAGLSTS